MILLACAGAKKIPPTVPSDKLQLDGILSLRVKGLSLQDYKKGRNAICRSPRQIETYSVG